MKSISKLTLAATITAVTTMGVAAQFDQGPAEGLSGTVTPLGLYFEPNDASNGTALRITGPGEFLLEQDFATSEPVDLPLVGLLLEDGHYYFEMVPRPESGKSPVPAVSGSFLVANGVVVDRDVDEGPPKDQVINDDLIVDGSACVGFDCVNGENFSFDTLRLKENNLRFHFDDTSVSASFPRNDWRFIANDSANGGASYLAIEDATAGRQVFRVDAGARANALRVDAQGDVGVGTSTPVTEIHMVSGDTPTLRLEQNGSSGFTPQSWDLAGNETNFFVRDVTNGSRLPFRIRPGAPTSAIDVAADGDIGIGTSSPDESLDIERNSAGAAAIRLADTSAGESWRTGLGSEAGATNVFAISTSTAPTDNRFVIFKGGAVRMGAQGAGGEQVFQLAANGDLSIDGTLSQGSDRNSKTNIVPVDGTAVLDSLASLEISEWSYRTDPSARHVGPMSQDFNEIFGYGPDDKHISPGDMAGLALGAIKELRREVQARDQKILRLEALVNELIEAQRE